MTATVVQIRDFHLKRLEKKAVEIISNVIDYREVARLGGPGGVDDLIFADTAPSEYNPDSGDCA
jgi:hypothetical protein